MLTLDYLYLASIAVILLILLSIWIKLKQISPFIHVVIDLKPQMAILIEQLKADLMYQVQKLQHMLETTIQDLQHALQTQHMEQREATEKGHMIHFKTQLDTQREHALSLQQQILAALSHHAQNLDNKVALLTDNTQQQLFMISGQVDKRLHEGFEKTNQTFADIIKRLALIDVAQQKITELSTNVVSLQEILADKRSRGAFGEVQLSALLHNVLPSKHFALQVTLSNNKRVDCLLYLPAPTGNIAIDAKFPLESYRTMTDITRSEQERKYAQQQFVQDIKKHIKDIREKYIIPGETSDSAVMFIPAEAIFAEIHGHYPELVDMANQYKVWLVSPTTLMAVLTTARAVLKDEATKQQIHIIQEHLRYLAKDFSRFQTRMDNLGKHFEQAHADIKDIHTSARKITDRFGRIEQVELTREDELT